MVPSRQGRLAASLPCGLLLLAACVSLCQPQEPRIKPADCDRREHPVISYRGENSISGNSAMSDQPRPHRVVLPLLFFHFVFSTEALGVRVLPPRSEGFLPAGCGLGWKPALCGGEVGFRSTCCRDPPKNGLNRLTARNCRSKTFFFLPFRNFLFRLSLNNISLIQVLTLT